MLHQASLLLLRGADRVTITSAKPLRKPADPQGTLAKLQGVTKHADKAKLIATPLQW